MNPILLITIPLFLLAVIVHEYAHGWVADKLGDPTAKNSGRLTFNPLAHIDPMGTIFLPLMLILMGSPIVFGWAKPVPINFSLLRHPRQDIIKVSVAGIAANLLLAVLLSLLLRAGVFPFKSYGWLVLSYGILINLVLAVFNAIPIPPLDGSKILASILPPQLAHSYLELERFGFLILIGALWLGLLDNIIWPVVAILASILGTGI